MAFIERNTLWREEYKCAVKAWISTLWVKLMSGLDRPNIPHVGDLNDRSLRDIGLRPGEAEPFRHQYPSQTTHHPRS